MTKEINELKLAAACRCAYAEFAAVPVLDLFSFALGYELATPEDTQREGSRFVQRAMTILGWGAPIDDVLLVALARRAKTPAYVPGNHRQDRYVAVRNGGKEVLVLASALTPGETEAVEQGRAEIARLDLWANRELAPVLKRIGQLL